jgi:hypothetical protein
MMVNFNSAVVIKDDKIDYNRKSITMKYIKSWFFIDLLASLPMNLISQVLLP